MNQQLNGFLLAVEQACSAEALVAASLDLAKISPQLPLNSIDQQAAINF